MGKNSVANRREDAYHKSGGLCWYCGRRPAEHIEHLDPKALGGSNDPKNLVGACPPCNFAKQGQGVRGNPNMNLEEFRQEVAYRLKVPLADVQFYGERLRRARKTFAEANPEVLKRALFRTGRLDQELGITADPFEFPDEPSMELWLRQTGSSDEL